MILIRLTLLTLLVFAIPASAAEKLKALIVDGQNNHAVWPKSTIMMKQYLTNSGLFEVDVERTKFISKYEREQDWLPLAGAGESVGVKKPTPDPDFSPDFNQYDVVISNFGYRAADWPEQTQRNLEKYMKAGGGLVVVHAADNSWANWKEFNKMIGLGGWGGRNETMLMTINYGEGRVFHTTLGHDTKAFEGVGFIVTFLRGSEWAATGQVTQEIPKDFSGAKNPTSRGFELKT